MRVGPETFGFREVPRTVWMTEKVGNAQALLEARKIDEGR